MPLPFDCDGGGDDGYEGADQNNNDSRCDRPRRTPAAVHALTAHDGHRSHRSSVLRRLAATEHSPEAQQETTALVQLPP